MNDFTPIQEINAPSIKAAKVQLFIKREDLNHPTIQGNKFRKLYPNLLQAKKENQNTLLTFGGAFSNHIYATAAAGKEYGFNTIGIIRGEKPKKIGSTLRFALEQNMTLHFVSRSEYRQKESIDFLESLKQKFGSFYLIPEGGTNSLAIQGCQMITQEAVRQLPDINYICSSVGTGGTISGIISGRLSQQHIHVLGFSSLKGDFLQKEVEALLPQIHSNWNINTDYHFGGYAKHNKQLISFINDFKQRFNIALDPIYTGKMMFGIFDLIQKGKFPKGAKILAIHTGGIQGIQGFNERYNNVII